MERQESSSALIIGLIIGGVVLLLLVVVGIFGIGAFYVREVRKVEEAAAALELRARELEPELPAAEQMSLTQRLIGVWETSLPDGGRETLDLRDDATYQSTTKPPGAKQAVPTTGRWEMVVEPDGFPKLIRIPDEGGRSEMEVRMVGEDRFILGGDGAKTYTRRKTPAK